MIKTPGKQCWIYLFNGVPIVTPSWITEHFTRKKSSWEGLPPVDELEKEWTIETQANSD